MKIPIALKKAIADDNLLLFVGAGLSYNATNIHNRPLKGWGNMVECILKELKNKGADVDHLIPLLKKYEPITILDLMEKDAAISKKEIYAFTKDFFDLDHNNNFELHEKLFQLSNKIITTNYDNAFELAVPELRKNKAYKGKNYELTTHKDSNSVLLFKLHGCFEDADSMVLFPSNYKNLYENPAKDAEHSLLVLRNIIVNKTILFIGTGMGDFQINSIFKEIGKLQGEYNQTHFIVTTNSLDSKLNFLTPITIDNHGKIPTIINSLIKIKNECKNTESAEVVELKEELEKANKKIQELENTSDKNKLLEREALKYFAKGVEYSLANNPIKAAEEYKLALELNPNHHEAFNNWGNSLGNLAETKEGQEAENLYIEAFDKYKRALEIKPDKHEALYNWGTDLGNLANAKQSQEAEELYKEAFDKFKRAIEIKPDFYQALYNWGVYLGNLAKTKQGKESDELYKEAFDKYKRAIEIKPDDHEALNNWGVHLGNLAKTKQGKESDELYKEAFDKYKRAIEIKPDYHQALYNWGICLGNLAKTKEGKEAEDLYEEAFDKFKRAIEIKPDDHHAFNSWGTDLGEIAKTKEGKEAEKLYQEAFDKLKKAIDIKPDFHQALNNWGVYLVNLAKTKQGKEAEELLNEAFGKFEKAIEFGASSYNLSCILALKGDTEKAFHYLEISLSKDEIDVDFVEKDAYWKAYWKDKRFLDLMRKYKM